MSVGDCEIRARLVGRSAERASDHHALDGPCRVPERAGDMDRRAREVARQGILVEENSAMVLGDHLEVLRLGTVSDEARTLLNADHMPRAIELRSQQARIRTSCRCRVPIGSGACQSVAGCADQNEEQDQENAEETDPKNREQVPDLRKGEKREWRACLPSKTVECAKHPSSPCRVFLLLSLIISSNTPRPAGRKITPWEVQANM